MIDYLKETSDLMSELIDTYPNQGFHLLPYSFGGSLRYAIVFTCNGHSIHDPNMSECGRFSAEQNGFYGLMPNHCDMISKHNEDYSNYTQAEPFRVTGTTVQDLVDFCHDVKKWKPRGYMISERFTLPSYNGDFVIRVENGFGDEDMLGDHVNKVRCITLEIDDVKKGLTWGEATELANALVRITGVGMFG